MKTLLLILPVVGAAWLAFSAEPAKSTDTSSPAEPSATPDVVQGPADPQPADSRHYDASIGQHLAQSGALTTRSERMEKENLLQRLNPFAPMKPVPESPWLSRAAWSTAAAEEHAGVPRPVETNHEVKVKVVVWRD